MSCYNNPHFKWSRKGGNLSDIHEWRITLDDFRNKKYTYYWNSIPIKNIEVPFLNGREYVTYVGFINDNYTSEYVNVDEINTISDMREVKLTELMT